MKDAIGVTIKKILISFLIVLSFFISSYAQLKENTLDSLINLALKVCPKLKMLNYKYEASKSRININSNLPDPMLTLGLVNSPTNTISFTQEPMTGKIIGLSQAVPFPGKLGAVENVASKDVEIVQQEIDNLKNKIRKIWNH